MAIANVALTDTFDVWRTRTNQLISLYDETNELARSSYNATNLAVVTSSNIAANIISGNSAVYNTIYDSTNTITLSVLTQIIPTFYDAANQSFARANAALVTSNAANVQANNARNFANSSNVYLVAYSSNTRNTVNLVFNSMNVEANITRTIANLAYNTANNFVANSSNSVAIVLASNTIIQNIVNNTANVAVNNYLANVSFDYVGNIANAAFAKANTGDITGVNAYDTANSAFNKANTAGGGYFVGNNGYSGNAVNKADIFRINANTITSNIVFSAGENASATGPLYMAPNSSIEIQTGARVAII